jgi:hypothetical protein
MVGDRGIDAMSSREPIEPSRHLNLRAMLIGMTGIGELLMRDKSIDIPLGQGYLISVLLSQKFSFGARRGGKLGQCIANSSNTSRDVYMGDPRWAKRGVDLPGALGDDGAGAFLALVGAKPSHGGV